jgi:P-type Cu2+ transporter
MKEYDYLIVGAGLYGAVMAHELKKKGKKCLVIDRRDHIAGNIYCEDIEGIHVHKYGAHIFHTSDKNGFLIDPASDTERLVDLRITDGLIQTLADAGTLTPENGEAEQKSEITQFQAVPGNGLSGKLGEDWLYGGNFKFISDKMKISASIKEQAERLAQQGKTPLFFGRNEQFLGMIAVADVIKEDSPQAVKELQNMGIHVVMLTGDNERTAKAIGEQAGVDEVIAGVLPEGKEQVIRKLKEKGKVAMVGDGINDAPALTRADMGIAIGAGTDIAIDAADVVLMKSRLSDVPAAIRMSRATLRNIHENLFWAFFYNAIGIPLAAGIWIPVFGWKLNPMFGAAAMSLSSFCVVTNALRLNLFKMYDASKDRKRKMKKVETAENTVSDIVLADKNESENKEETKMTKTMKIEGMMCGHCEAAVKKALEALEQVDTAEVSHEAGTAVVTLNSEISNEVLKKTVEDKDYTVTAIED